MLQGNCSGWYSIRINDEWRLCSRSVDGDAYDAEIVDFQWSEPHRLDTLAVGFSQYGCWAREEE